MGALDRCLSARRHGDAAVGARDVGVELYRVGGAAGDGHRQLERLRLARGDAQPRPVEGLAVDERIGRPAGQFGKGLQRIYSEKSGRCAISDSPLTAAEPELVIFGR